jgi:transcription antitermination protein NusB
MTNDARQGAARSGERRRGRVAALQMLYQWEVGRVPMPEVRRMYWHGDDERGDPSDRSRSFATTLADGTVEHVAEIDALLEASAEHWRVARMPVMDRLVLRLAVYELLYERGTPPAVVIDEALELAKQFSTPEAARFVNGVLDAVRKRLQPDTSSRV